MSVSKTPVASNGSRVKPFERPSEDKSFHYYENRPSSKTKSPLVNQENRLPNHHLGHDYEYLLSVERKYIAKLEKKVKKRDK